MDDQNITIIKKALTAVRPVFRLSLLDGVHGVPHWSRVWIHGRFLASEMSLNPAVLAWFAFLHDSQRHNDWLDRRHGQRAADFAVQLRRSGTLNELADREFECLCEAMRLHSDGHVEAEPLIQACWDSDRLDLSRVGILPHPDRLCTAAARRTEIIDEAIRLGVGGQPQRPRS